MNHIYFPIATCPLNLQFILQALIDQDRDKLCFYLNILLQTSPIKPTILEEMHMPRLFETLLPFLFEARFDENLLVYLIENKEKLNGSLGTGRIEQLLQNFFPEGHDQLRTVIHEGYARRGFTQFLASIEPLIEAVKWGEPLTS